MEELKRRVAAYLQHKMPDVMEVTVTSAARIHGGASRETYRLRARWHDGDTSHERGLIIRRDPTAGLLEVDCGVEFAAYRAFHPIGLPVPEPLFLETDPQWLERPFFIMAEVEDCDAASPMTAEPYGPHAAKIGRQFFTYLGHIAAQDPAALGLVGTLAPVAPEACWQRELAHWEQVIDTDEVRPQPVARAAIRWMRRNPPPPPTKVTVVHGDYRSGNFLFDASGDIQAILDWEMCHLGDPLEDLAWAIDPLWAMKTPDRPGGMLPRDEALRIWEAATGQRVDPVALRWWEIFSHVKGLAIWISAGKEYHSGTNMDPILAFPSWYCTDVHNRLIVAKLAAPHEEQAR